MPHLPSQQWGVSPCTSRQHPTAYTLLGPDLPILADTSVVSSMNVFHKALHLLFIEQRNSSHFWSSTPEAYHHLQCLKQRCGSFGSARLPVSSLLGRVVIWPFFSRVSNPVLACLQLSPNISWVIEKVLGPSTYGASFSNKE